MARLVINAGGTSTKVAVLEEQQSRKDLFEAANFQTVGINGIRILLENILKKLNAKPNQYTVIAGFAGAVNESDFAQIKNTFIELGFSSDKIEVTGDLNLYLKVLPPETALLISGTGSIGAMVQNGKVMRVGGYGPLSGDKGSGLELGRDAIRHALWGYEGRIAATVLTERVAKFLNLKQIIDIIRPLNNGELSHSKIASLSPIVFEAAREADHAALSIIKHCAQGLASILSVLLKKVPQKAPKVALCGGLFEGDSREILFNLLKSENKIECEYLFFGERPPDINLMQALIKV